MLKRLVLAGLLAFAVSGPARADFEFSDIACETTTTSGTGTVDLAGALTGGYLGFLAAGIDSGDTVPYHIRNGSQLETGIGTFTDGTPDTLSRTAFLSTDGSGNELTLSGTSSVCIGPTTQVFTAGVSVFTLDQLNFATDKGISWDSGSILLEKQAPFADTNGLYVLATSTGDAVTGGFFVRELTDEAGIKFAMDANGEAGFEFTVLQDLNASAWEGYAVADDALFYYFGAGNLVFVNDGGGTGEIQFGTGSDNATYASFLNGSLTLPADGFIGDDLSLTSDGAVINIGAASDCVITHTSNTLTLTSCSAVGFGGVSDADKGDITVSSSGSVWDVDPAITVDSTADAVDGIVWTFEHSDPTPDAGDDPFEIVVNAGDDQEAVGRIQLELLDDATTTEDTSWLHTLRQAGSDVTALTLGAGTGVNSDAQSHVFSFGSATGTVEAHSTATGGDGPYFLTYHNSSSPAAEDHIGGLHMYGESSTGALVQYGILLANIIDTTNAAPGSSLEMYVQDASTPARIRAMQVNGFTDQMGAGFGTTTTANLGRSDGGAFEIYSESPTANGPSLVLAQNSASEANNDDVGKISFIGKSDNDTVTSYGQIHVNADDISNANPDGSMVFTLRTAGSAVENLKLTGTTATLGGAQVEKAGTQMIYVPAAAMIGRATSGADCSATLDSGASDVTIRVCNFDTAADEHSQFTISMPPRWNEGTVTFQAVWSTTGASTPGETFDAELSCLAISDDDPINASMGTPIAVNDTMLSADGDLMTSAVSSAVTCAGTPQANDTVVFNFMRDVSDDNAAADVSLIGVRLFITTDTANDG